MRLHRGDDRRRSPVELPGPSEPPNSSFMKPGPTSIATVSIVAIVLLILGGTTGEARPQAARDQLESYWGHSLEEAEKQARTKEFWVVAYFESPFSTRKPPALVDAVLARELERQGSIGATVNADEVVEAAERFGIQVTRLPAIVLIDPLGTMRDRWELRLDRQAIHRSLVERARAFSEVRGKLRDAVKVAEGEISQEDLRGAIRALLPVLGVQKPEFPELARVRELRGDLRGRLEKLYLVLMAGEGIERDAQIVKELKKLARTYPLPEFKRRIDRELDRIERRRIGGR